MLQSSIAERITTLMQSSYGVRSEGGAQGARVNNAKTAVDISALMAGIMMTFTVCV